MIKCYKQKGTVQFSVSVKLCMQAGLAGAGARAATDLS